MVILGVVELVQHFYFSGDYRVDVLFLQFVLVKVAGGAGKSEVFFTVGVNSAAVLGATVVALPVALGWIVSFPEDLD